MKKVLLLTFISISTIVLGQTKSYPGNGNASFGGAVGLGSLSITDSGDSVSFMLRRGTGLFDSLLVFYIDDPKTATGISSTSGLSYQSGVPDKYSNAAAGQSPTGQQAVLNFGNNFRPDLAVVFDKDGGRIYFLFETFGFRFYQQQGTFTITPSGTNAAPTYTQKSSKADFGVANNDTLNFNFYGTYIGQNASRSNEAFGDPMTGYQRVGSYNPYTVTTFFNYSTRQAALPVSITKINATEVNGKVSIDWVVAQEVNIDQYDLQRSANGIQFSTIASIKAKNASTSTNYNFVDATALKGINYYRIVVREKGKSQITNVVSAKVATSKASLSAYINNNRLNLKLRGLTEDVYTIKVVNTNGQILQSTTLHHDGVDATRQVNLKSTLSKGIYQVVIQSATDNNVVSFYVQ